MSDYKSKTVKCKLVPLDDNGNKIFHHTLNKEYEAESYNSGGDWHVEDDNGKVDNFFDLRMIFTDSE